MEQAWGRKIGEGGKGQRQGAVVPVRPPAVHLQQKRAARMEEGGESNRMERGTRSGQKKPVLASRVGHAISISFFIL
jgi:hypothetical protein